MACGVYRRKTGLTTLSLVQYDMNLEAKERLFMVITNDDLHGRQEDSESFCRNLGKTVRCITRRCIR